MEVVAAQTASTADNSEISFFHGWVFPDDDIWPAFLGRRRPDYRDGPIPDLSGVYLDGWQIAITSI